MRRLLLTALAGVAACAPELNWREWRTPEVGLTQLFPCKPVRQQRQVALTGRPLQLVLQVCDSADVTWAVAYADVADPSAVAPALRALAEAAHANLGVATTAPEPLAVAGATPQDGAGRFRFRGIARDGRTLDEALVVFARGTVVFQVTALGPKLADDSLETFIGSLRAGS